MPPTGLSAALRRRVADFLEASLDSRSKRIVFLASLAARLSSTYHLNKETRHKLNKIMQLAHGDASLVLPYELSEVIWRGKSGVEIFRADPTASELTQDMIAQMSESVLDAMPTWLRYGEAATMQQDVGRLLENRTAVFGS